MSYWWIDRVLPGLVATAVWAVPAFVLQHFALTRKFRDVTGKQTAELKQHLAGRGGVPGDPPTERPPP